MSAGSGTAEPMLLLTAPDETLPFDGYLEEILHSEGWCCHKHAHPEEYHSPAQLGRHFLVVISCGAARRMDPATIEQYLKSGGRVICIKPPRQWGCIFGLQPRTVETYATVRNAYIRVRDDHPWLDSFPAHDLQVHGEAHIYERRDDNCLARVAGQRGQVTPFPAVTHASVGRGRVVLFAFDLAECIVLHHQGRIANASTGADPDANRDAKFTADDLFEGMRDFQLRHVPQADALQELLTRTIDGLMGEVSPLPRLWRFPSAAPGLVLLDGDGDGMCPADMRATVEICERHDAHFTFFLMEEELRSFDPQELRHIRARGHGIGPHPRVPMRPSVQQWRTGVRHITQDLTSRLGFEPVSIRMHSCVLPGWDEAPRELAELGLHLDTSFLEGYRHQSGFLNGSALPARFIDRAGNILDCWEQSTVLGDDTLVTTKTMLPPKTEQECIDLSLELMHELATRYHGVFHPYFHPINVGGHGRMETGRWLDAVLSEAAELGMPAPSSDEWLAFTMARRATRMEHVVWDPGLQQLSFRLVSELSADELTILLPSFSGQNPMHVEVGSEDCPLTEVAGQAALSVDVDRGAQLQVTVRYGA